MGTDDSGDHVYDLRRIEDIFACLEIISVARGAMFGVNPEIARRMEKVSDALGAFAQIVMEGGLGAAAEQSSHAANAGVPEKEAAPGGLDVFADLTGGTSPDKAVTGHAPPSSSQGGRGGPKPDEEIVDILTGEKIK